MQSNRIFSYSAALVILVTVCFGVGNARADVTGQISGAVKDPAGAMMAGVVVSVSNMDTGFQQTTKTDFQGVFGFPALPVGHYTLRALQKSFKEYGQEGLTLDVNTALLRLCSSSEQRRSRSQWMHRRFRLRPRAPRWVQSSPLKR